MADIEWQSGKLLPKKQIRRFWKAFDNLNRRNIGISCLINLFVFLYWIFFFAHDKIMTSRIAILVIVEICCLIGLILGVLSANKYKKRIKSRDFQWRQADVQWFHAKTGARGDRSYAVADGEKLTPIDSPDDHIIYDIGERIIIVLFDKTDQIYCIRAVRREEPDDQ